MQQQAQQSFNLGALKQKFDRDGFVVIPNFFSHDEVRAFREHGDSYVRDVVPTLKHHQQHEFIGTTKQLEDNCSWFREQLNREDHLHLMSTLLGNQLEVGCAAWNDKPWNSVATRRHQDSIGNPTRQGITLWVALDEADRENGCLHYGIGSHQQGMLSNLDEFVTGAPSDVAVEVQPGDAVLHHSYTVHWTDENRTTRPRRAYTCFHWGRATTEEKTKPKPGANLNTVLGGHMAAKNYDLKDLYEQYVHTLAAHLGIDQQSARGIVMRSMKGDATAAAIVTKHKALL